MRLFSASALATAALLVAMPAAAQDRSGWPDSLTVGTASQGGTYFVYGNGLASFIGEELGINASGEVTGGPVQNVTLVQLGDHDIGLVTMGPAYEAWTGHSELAPGLEHRDIRALFPMYQTPFQVITLASSGITSVSELAGHRVSVGPAGGTPGTYWPRFLETLGVDATVSNAGAADAASQLKDGLIDAFAFAAGVPISAFSQLAAEADVRMFGFTPDELQTILAAHPEVSPLTIPAGTYAGVDYDQQSVAMWNFAIANASMPDSLAYEITRLVMENHDRMMEIHRAASETTMDNVLNDTFLPFHPGAVRYYEEHGITIPENLRG
ncbi:MAG: TAXI family TRAP transporter solute-binding subunit [Rhodobacter sp.]|uniref:TAXI family TRAP transporter solute-binding subunit n=1 Tax=Pararhodobacter sp. TaxID=2127056 RepID=UPI001D2F42BC|nr:TAXI family TRAP transporter solute-binding subunit [Pararhodobacter sp.]MCB1345221.1 TAXI family TRAP transporter solute-binding subunit [Paracoccaceae bacterium]MCC0074665.1 TAXI family TRAP transporter solute-binding subunit [Rhodobacter sp.]HPD92770.1 TAXI family TRAP transporter solute-binding subunit [Pararhodobacter sp.]